MRFLEGFSNPVFYWVDIVKCDDDAELVFHMRSKKVVNEERSKVKIS